MTFDDISSFRETTKNLNVILKIYYALFIFLFHHIFFYVISSIPLYLRMLLLHLTLSLFVSRTCTLLLSALSLTFTCGSLPQFNLVLAAQQMIRRIAPTKKKKMFRL